MCKFLRKWRLFIALSAFSQDSADRSGRSSYTVSRRRTRVTSIERYAWQELSSDDKKYVAEYLNETDENRKNAIAEIKCWLETNDDVRIRIDDFFLLQFLRVCKFDIEKTQIRIRNYSKQTSKLSEWYLNTDPFLPELQELLDLGLYLPLRKPDNKGRLVIIGQGTRHDPRIHKISDFSKIGVMVMEIAIKYYPAASIYGYTLFIDVANPTMRHIIQYNPFVLMNMVHAWQNCYPMRVPSINLINVPVIFDVVQILKSFMSKKMQSRFNVHSQRTMKNCFENIPTDILPVEYGGTGGTIQELTEYWKKLIEENRDWLTIKENDKITVSAVNSESIENVQS